MGKSLLDKMKGVIHKRNTEAEVARFEADIKAAGHLPSFRASQHWNTLVFYIGDVMREHLELMQKKIYDKEELYVINIRLETLRRIQDDIEAKIARALVASAELAEINDLKKLKESQNA